MALAPARRVPLAGMRKVIAARMRESLARSAQLTLHRDSEASALVAHRRRLERPPSLTAYLARAFALALREHPAFNCRLEGEELLLFDRVNLGVAVALEGGLVAPVVRDAQDLGVAEIHAAIVDLAERARTKRLTLRDFEDSTASLSNLGALGVDGFTPILNPPEAAILGAGRVRTVLVPGEREPRAADLLVLSLTFDHQVADGSQGAALLRTLERILSDPGRL